jgi:hypothetical protein
MADLWLARVVELAIRRAPPYEKQGLGDSGLCCACDMGLGILSFEKAGQG